MKEDDRHRRIDKSIPVLIEYSREVIMKKNCLLFIILLALVLLAGCKIDPDTTYRVNYYDNGSTSGYPPVDRNEYKSGDEATVLDKESLIKTGYEFLRWNTDSKGTGESYSPGDKITIKGAVFLYAIWVVKP